MKYFSLFSGIGGLEYGLNQKKFKCVGISEIKNSSVRIYKKNYGEVKNWGDIRRIDVKKLPGFNILLGGFPCQAFSLAGFRKGFEDRRGKMIFYIYDILKEKQPEFVVLENVKGILSHNKGKTYKDVFKLLAVAGYFVRVVLLNSCYYGSAQNRERVFFLASKKDFKMRYPEKQDELKRFRDIRDSGVENFVWYKKEIKGDEYGLELVGGYDRVGTLMTSRQNKLVREGNRFRYLTELEAERLQGFPDGFTEGFSSAERWFALGNAVNRNVSDYLFNNYLRGLWW